MKTLLFAVFAALFALGTAASAGEMAPKTMDYGYGGGYIGGHGGYAWGNRMGEFELFGEGGDSFDYDLSGWLVGAQVGYNHIISEKFLVGLEASGSLASITGTGNFGEELPGNGEYNSLGTFKARIGYVMDKFLLFATGGLAVAGFDFDSSAGCQFDQTRTGYLVGGGGEFKVSEKASVGVEYNYMDFGSQEQFCTSFAFIPTASIADADLSVIRFYFNYSLGSL